MVKRNFAPYWVFVCNPKKWAIDRYLERESSTIHGVSASLTVTASHPANWEVFV
jgi:hypothetical protein